MCSALRMCLSSLCVLRGRDLKLLQGEEGSRWGGRRLHEVSIHQDSSKNTVSQILKNSKI